MRHSKSIIQRSLFWHSSSCFQTWQEAESLYQNEQTQGVLKVHPTKCGQQIVSCLICCHSIFTARDTEWRLGIFCLMHQNTFAGFGYCALECVAYMIFSPLLGNKKVWDCQVTSKILKTIISSTLPNVLPNVL